MEGGKCEANERKLASRIQTYKAALS